MYSADSIHKSISSFSHISTHSQILKFLIIYLPVFSLFITTKLCIIHISITYIYTFPYNHISIMLYLHITRATYLSICILVTFHTHYYIPRANFHKSIFIILYYIHEIISHATQFLYIIPYSMFIFQTL